MSEIIRLKGILDNYNGDELGKPIMDSFAEIILPLDQLKEQLKGYEIKEKEEKQPEKKDDIVEELKKLRIDFDCSRVGIPESFCNLLDILITKFKKEE